MIGQEEAPTTGTPHLHVYISFEKQVYVTYCQKIVQAHWEPVKDRAKCIEYCTKDGVVLVNELLTKPTKRELCDAIEHMQSEGLAGVAREYPYQFVLHSRGLRDLLYAEVMQRPKPVP